MMINGMENLDIELNLPQSLFNKEPQPSELDFSGILPSPNTSTGTTITGQGQKPTTNLDQTTKKAIITDMDTTEAIAERQGTI